MFPSLCWQCTHTGHRHAKKAHTKPNNRTRLDTKGKTVKTSLWKILRRERQTFSCACISTFSIHLCSLRFSFSIICCWVRFGRFFFEECLTFWTKDTDAVQKIRRQAIEWVNFEGEKKYNQQLLKPKEMLSLLSQDSTWSQKKRAKWSCRNKSHGIISGIIPQQKERKSFFNQKYSSLKNKTKRQSISKRKSHTIY